MLEILEEKYLIPIISQNAIKFGKNLASAFELSSGFGIADVVLYKMEDKVIRERIKKDIGPLPYEILNIIEKLDNLEKRKFNITFLNKNIPETKKNKKLVTYLIEKEFLIPTDVDNQEFKIGIKYKMGVKEMIAIEAKLSDWKRGLYQAYRYKRFANESYLALYTKYINRAYRNKDEFENLGIGLVEVNNDDIRILIQAKKKPIEKNIFSLLASENILNINKKLFPNSL